MPHSDGLDELSTALHSAGVHHALYHDCIWITLPGNQGNVEVKAWPHQSRTAQLAVNREWVSLSEVEGEFDVPPEEVIARITEKLSKRGLSLQQGTHD
jgi:hypothetical protein